MEVRFKYQEHRVRPDNCLNVITQQEKDTRLDAKKELLNDLEAERITLWKRKGEEEEKRQKIL